jgi:hypothetical protein
LQALYLPDRPDVTTQAIEIPTAAVYRSHRQVLWKKAAHKPGSADNSAAWHATTLTCMSELHPYPKSAA